MYREILFGASLMLASTAQAQTPDRALMNYALASYSITGTLSGTATGRVDRAPAIRITGDRALMGQWPSALPVGAGGAETQSPFRAEIRGDVTSSAWGDAEFGAVQNPDRSSGAFVVSLGACSHQGAILFTRRSGAPLEVGRYRISAGANGEDEILALVITGRPTNPTGAFRGESGWLVVTAASDRLITGRFHVDAIGFVAAEPQREDRHVKVDGSLSAAAASSSFRVCEDAA
jgi:hypothetical protein